MVTLSIFQASLTRLKRKLELQSILWVKVILIISQLICMNISISFDAPGGYKAVSGLKRYNPALKVLIAVGGWNEGGRKFSIMAATTESRKMFIDSVVGFLKEYNYDGVTLDWEYPGNFFLFKKWDLLIFS